MRVDAVANPDVTHYYYYNDSWQLLEERKEVSDTEDTDPLNQYVWHPYYIDALAVRWWDEDVDGSDVVDYCYLQDANYNVTAAVNSSGTVVERYAYSPYGGVNILNATFGLLTESAIGNTHLYTGRERDPETGLQLNRHRFYAAHLGRWLTRDPIGYEGSPYNLYEYTSGSPLIYVDPDGNAIVGIVIITITVGRGIGHGICSLLYLYYCLECWDRAQKFVQATARTWGQQNALAFQNWLRSARPGSECAELCAKAGYHGIYFAVWLSAGVIIKYGIRLVE